MKRDKTDVVQQQLCGWNLMRCACFDDTFALGRVKHMLVIHYLFHIFVSRAVAKIEIRAKP